MNQRNRFYPNMPIDKCKELNGKPVGPVGCIIEDKTSKLYNIGENLRYGFRGYRNNNSYSDIIHDVTAAASSPISGAITAVEALKQGWDQIERCNDIMEEASDSLEEGRWDDIDFSRAYFVNKKCGSEEEFRKSLKRKAISK